MDLLKLALVPLLRDMPDMPGPTELQRLQLRLLDLVADSRLTDEQTALGFRDFLVEVAAREGARGR
jgi:hypothetical protein